jgi:hypothetical protein
LKQSTMETNVHHDDHEVRLFTYHKQSGYIGFTWAMIGVIVLESVGVSFLLYKWSPILHWLHLILCIFIGVFLIVDLKAVVKNPISLKDNELAVKIGIRPKVLIDVKNIKELRSGNIHYEKDRKIKEVLDLSLLGFDAPTFEIELNEPIESKALIGKSHMVRRIFLSVDEKDAFYNMINERQKVEFQDSVMGEK